jgi:hypothetical protein
MKIESRNLWITIAAVLLYILLADLYFEFVINREMRFELQLIISFFFLIATYIVLKLIVKNVVNQIKLKKEEK